MYIIYFVEVDASDVVVNSFDVWSLVDVLYFVMFYFYALRHDCHRSIRDGISSASLYYWMMCSKTTIDLFNSHRNYSNARSCRS